VLHVRAPPSSINPNQEAPISQGPALNGSAGSASLYALVHKARARELLLPACRARAQLKRDRRGLYVSSQSKLASLGGYYRVRNNTVLMFRGAYAGPRSPSRSLGRFGHQQLHRLWPCGSGYRLQGRLHRHGLHILHYQFYGDRKARGGGPFTFTGTSTGFFGLFGSALTANGAVNPDGTRAGVCVPTFGSGHTVFANGTIDTEAKGESCCVGTSCGAVGLGPPITGHESSVCISGTGKFAGIQCSAEDTSSSIDAVHSIGRGEIGSTK